MLTTKYFTEAQLSFLKMTIELHEDSFSSYKNSRSRWTRGIIERKTYDNTEAYSLNAIADEYKEWKSGNDEMQITTSQAYLTITRTRDYFVVTDYNTNTSRKFLTAEGAREYAKTR